MTTVNFSYPKFKYTIASTGQPGAGYKLFTYEEGTSTKKTTWTSLAKTAENTNPIVLDANGEADVWIDGNYKFVLAPPTDTDPPTSPVWTIDAIRSTDGGASVAGSSDKPTNGSFETDSDSDTVPDNWTAVELTGGTVAIDSSSSTHGTNSVKFTSTGSGGGTLSTDDYYGVEAGKVVGTRFSIISSNADTHNKVEVYWYNAAKIYLSASAVYDDAATNPTSWTRKYLSATAPATAKFARIVLTGVAADSVSHTNTWFDNIELDVGFTGEIPSDLNQYTLSAAEANILDGATVTTAELNVLDGITATTDELNVLDGIPPTLTATELGYVDGVTSAIQTQFNNTNTTSNILTLTAGASVGGIGTYAFLGTTITVSYSPGSTLAGSSLRYAGITGSTSWTNSSVTAAPHAGNGGTPAGTWRCMGIAYNGGGGADYGATLWLRIA